MDDMEEKRCNVCNQKFPSTTNYFHRDGYDKDGEIRLRATCKKCQNEKNKRARLTTIKEIDNNNKQEKEVKRYIEDVKSGLVSLTPTDWKKERVDFIDINDIDDYLKTVEFAESIGYDEVSFQTDKDCAIPWIADKHTGSVYTHHRYISKIIRSCRDIDNVFPIFGGDYCDNYTAGTRMLGGVHDQRIPLPKQKNMVKTWVETLDTKLLGVIQGCHDEWMFKANEFDFSTYLASHSKTGKPLGFESFIDMKVGNYDYRMLARHKYPKWSSLNHCHGLLQYIRENHHDVDVVFGAHRHLPSTATQYIDGRMVTAVRTSSFKITDRWQSHKGFTKSPILLPTIVLHAKEWKILVFQTFEEAMNYLKERNK